MSLTQHQSEILEQSLQILENNKRLVIKGSAGVGKTYMVNELLKRIKVRKKIYCSAPTNKAVAVLKGKVDSKPISSFTNRPLEVEFITTHAALKLKRNIHSKTGEISFKPSYQRGEKPLKGVGLFVIDEASMLNTELLGYIEEYANLYNVTVIFIGDNKQLNPVGEENSIVFHSQYPEVELTEIVRQKEGNPIIDLSRSLDTLDSYERNDNVANPDETLIGYLFSNNKNKVINTLAAVNGTDEVKYLAWTNQEVDLMNFLVRKKIYGEPKKIELEETLVFNSPYKDSYYTNQEVKVEDCIVREKKFHFLWNQQADFVCDDEDDPRMQSIKLKYYSINPNIIEQEGKEPSITDRIIVVHEDSEQDHLKIVNNLKQRAKFKKIEWKDFYSFIEQFADLKYNHAISVHKSQGSTYQKAIVNLRNIEKNRNNKEKKRLLYTAITRASDLLILYNH